MAHYRFVSEYRRFAFKIPRDDRDYDYVRRYAKSGMFMFSDDREKQVGTHRTDDERIAQFLRRMIRSRNIAAREDLSSMPLPCPVQGCDWRSETSGPEGMEERYNHLIDVHGDQFLGGPVEDKKASTRRRSTKKQEEEPVEREEEETLAEETLAEDPPSEDEA